MANPFQLGFLGGANDSAIGRVHYSACRMDGRWEVASGCFSRKPGVNADTAKQYGVKPDHTYENLEEMLRKEKNRLDAVAVLTPTPTHSAIVLKCLNAGIPVICEKSLATTLPELEEIKKTCVEKKSFLAVTYNYSGYPMIRELREMIRHGELGEILHFQAEMPQEGYLRLAADGNRIPPQEWRLHDGEIPMIYLDLAAHLHEVIHYLLGCRPLEVAADHASKGWFRNTIDQMSCLLCYENDILGQMWISKSALGYRNGMRIRIFGSKASAEWLQTSPEELLISSGDGSRYVLDRGNPKLRVAGENRYQRFKAGHPAGFIEAFSNLYDDIADCLTEYKADGIWSSGEVFSTELAAEEMALLEATARSVRTRSWEKIG